MQAAVQSLGDPALDAIRDGWNASTRVSSEVIILLQQATPIQRRQALLACYQAVVKGRGLQNDAFAQRVIRLATQAIEGRLTGSLLEESYRQISQQARTGSYRGNCTISSVLLTPELHGGDMKGYMETFLREAPQNTDLNGVVRRLLLE